jgi:hypothetical protein
MKVFDFRESADAAHSSEAESSAQSIQSAVSLPFTVNIVRTEEHLRKAVGIRAESYGRHHPEVAELLKSAEVADRSSFSLVLLAESKEDGSALGTLRIETNAHGRLPAEGLMPPNSPCRGKTVAFVTRLAVAAGKDSSLVKLALFKALHRYCLACQIEWILVTARPPMDRQYKRLGFSEAYDVETYIPISWSGNIPMRIMTLEVIACERNWKKAEHPLYQFMFVDYCADIKIFKSVSGIWNTPRIRSSPPSSAYLDRLLGDNV